MSDEKRMAGDYEIIQSVYIGDREIVVGENQADSDGLPYLVAYYESNAILGRYYDAVVSDDFPEIMEIYTDGASRSRPRKPVQSCPNPKYRALTTAPSPLRGVRPSAMTMI